MGLDKYGKQFCDLCHRTAEHFEKKVSFYRCGECGPESRPLLCVCCATVHYRHKHPARWAELLLPKIKEQNEEARKDRRPETA